MQYRFQIAVLAHLTALAGCAAPPTQPDAAAAAGAPLAAIPSAPYVPGQAYFGRNNYIEYIAGNDPVIFTAPHGGVLAPAEIPDRTPGACGGAATTTTDLNTAELVRSMQQKYFARFGKYPHVIITHLTRKKLDANRDLLEGACGDPEAAIAYDEWHDFIDVAKNSVLTASGKGWYMDMHGHGHSIQRLELGYLLSAAQVNLSDASLDANIAFQDTSGVRTLSEFSPPSFSTLLRGASSLGTLYANAGFRSIPSSADPRPNSDSYFSGGDNTRRHGCGAEATALGGVTGGNICGVQIEANFTGVRDNVTNRERFGDATAVVLEQYLSTHWGLQLGMATPPPPPPPPPPITLSARGYKVKGSARADLTWSGATGTSVNIYRNTVNVATTPNDGTHTDVLGKVSGTFTYKVCNAGTTACSANSTVTF